MCRGADCDETDERVEITNSSSPATTAAAAAAAASTAAVPAVDDDVNPLERFTLSISPQPNNYSELVRAVGSSVVFTCRRLSNHHDDDGNDDDDDGHLAAEATTVEWFDKNDMRIRPQTAHRLCLIILRPHRSTTYVDAACCYRPSSVVCRSVCRSVCHTSEPCKNG